MDQYAKVWMLWMVEEMLLPNSSTKVDTMYHPLLESFHTSGTFNWVLANFRSDELEHILVAFIEYIIFFNGSIRCRFFLLLCETFYEGTKCIDPRSTIIESNKKPSSIKLWNLIKHR